MTGPQDPSAADDGWLRAGHADREQAIETLKDAFVHGRLTKDELDSRAGQALSARTRAELAALTADLPTVPAAAVPAAAAPVPVRAPAAPVRPPVVARRRRPLVTAAAGSGSCLIVTTLAMSAHHVVDPGNGAAPYDAWATPLFLIAAFSVVVALGILAYGGITWTEERARRELPPPPGPDGRIARAADRPDRAAPNPGLPRRHPDQDRTELRAHQPRRRTIPARRSQSRGVRAAPGAA